MLFTVRSKPQGTVPVEAITLAIPVVPLSSFIPKADRATFRALPHVTRKLHRVAREQCDIVGVCAHQRPGGRSLISITVGPRETGVEWNVLSGKRPLFVSIHYEYLRPHLERIATIQKRSQIFGCPYLCAPMSDHGTTG